MHLLLISNSTNPGEAYLDYPKYEIQSFLNKHQVSEVLFIPFAAVTFSYDIYLSKVQERFQEIGIQVKGIHQQTSFQEAVKQAQAIVVGGGNTFHLLKSLQDAGLVELIADKVQKGCPYIGWSAGANLASPTICTTNDMPIVEPKGFKAFHFIPFQINPHYIDSHPAGHAGETREQRIEEYLVAQPKVRVVGLRETSMLKIEAGQMQLIGEKSIRIFHQGDTPLELSKKDDLQFLLSE